MLSTIAVLGALLAILPQVAVYMVHILYILRSESRPPRTPSISTCRKAHDISFILPVRKEPIEYIERALRHIGSLGIPEYEVVLVSDDDEHAKNAILSLVSKLREEGINVWFIWRSIPVAGRTGALNVGLYASRGKYVYVYDVDTLPSPEFFDCAVTILETCGKCFGVVGEWVALNRDSRVSEALYLGMKFVRSILYNARNRLGLHIYPLGTGTLYKACILKSVFNGWDPERVQDDVELGIRALCSDYEVVFLEGFYIKVENPSTYKAFRVQQSRWAYGALDALLARFSCFAKSRKPALVRLESLMYALQYIPSALVFTGGFILGAVQIASPCPVLEALPLLFVIWVIATATYTYMIYAKTGKGDYKAFFVLAGRLSAISTAVTPYIAFSTLKALLRVKEVYKRTPKGYYQQVRERLRIPWELLFATYFAIASLRALLGGCILTCIFLATLSLPFFYVTYRFKQDVFYE